MEPVSACPVDVEETAEAYVMGHLSPEQAITFEDHYNGCDACVEAVEQAGSYVAALRSATAEFRSKNPGTRNRFLTRAPNLGSLS